MEGARIQMGAVLVMLSLLVGCGQAYPDSVGDLGTPEAATTILTGVEVTEAESGASVSSLATTELGSLRPGMEHLLPCVEFEESGYYQVFHDGRSAGLEQMATDLMAIENANHDTVAGVAYCTDNDGMAFFIKSGSEGARQESDVVAAQYPQYLLHFFEVPRSMNDMMALVDQLGPYWQEIGISGMAPDIYTGGLVIELLPDVSIDEATRAVTAVIGPGVPLIVTDGGEIVQPDWAPPYGWPGLEQTD
ncbi:MAG: hypothetical protein FWG16_06460 [Micrococcales bacterium]|nr:hypothetical protein [Micrococcales bacterium]